MNGGDTPTLAWMLRSAILAAALLLLSAACTPSGGDPGDNPDEVPDQTTSSENPPTNLTFGEVQAGASGAGSEEPGLLVSSSPGQMWNALQIPSAVPDDSNVTYLAASLGERGTGGYSVTVERITARDGRIEVVVSESEPPEGARVTQALTYPFAVVAVEGIAASDLRETPFVAVDPDGEELGWMIEILGE